MKIIFFKSVVYSKILLSSLPISCLDFVIRHKSFPSRKLKIAVRNVGGLGSGFFGCWKLAFRFEGVAWNVGWINDNLGTLVSRILELGVRIRWCWRCIHCWCSVTALILRLPFSLLCTFSFLYINHVIHFIFRMLFKLSNKIP